ncbi:MAG: anti-sigma factor antagonist [Acidimicrobiia bacterium]|nr:anti-sigma factor antagonist [Acidimicrobiia bacterium]
MDPAPHLSIELIRPRDGKDVVLVLVGELDPLSGPSLLARVDEAVEGAPEGRVVLDLADLAFIDSSGLRALVDVHSNLKRQGTRLVLRRPSRPALRLLQITSLDVVFDLEGPFPIDDGP